MSSVRPDAPPMLLIHGAADRLIAHEQSEALADALRGCGAPVQLVLVPDADHMWRGNPAAAREALELTVGFLREQLGQ